jgi:hypothetical protein
MGTFTQYQCSHCKTKFELGGPQEYKKTIFGKLKVRHASNGMKENISGLWVYLWDEDTQKVEKRIMVEFERKCSSLEVWGRRAPAKPKYINGFEGQYDSLKTGKELLNSIPLETKCKKCHKGEIEFLRQIQT